VCATGVVARAQTPAQPAPTGSPPVVAEPSGDAVTLTYFNRPILVYRARVLGRGPAERAAAASRALDEQVAQGQTGPVTSTPIQDGAAFISVGGRGVIALTSADVDELSGETLQQAVNDARNRLEQALAEAAEARRPAQIAQSAAMALAALAVGLSLMYFVHRSRRAATARLEKLAEHSVGKLRVADVGLLHASRLIDLQRRAVLLGAAVLQLAIGYSMITFVLRRFPFTRPWGEAMRGYLIESVVNLGLGIAGSIPRVFTIVLIFLVARFVARLVSLWFQAVQHGRVEAPGWLHPETAEPTRRLLTACVWLLGLVAAYPYFPGSQTEAFKGVSVLLGLMLTLGSSGIVTQVMSSFMITYSRALRVGDFVRIGEVEGTVTQLGMLSTKIKTPRNEEVTIPNALVISQTTTDFSRLTHANGVLTPTSVTIGYDAPWRQVHALLLKAAERTPGLRADHTPVVLQTALEDFYVKYTLLVGLQRQEARVPTLAVLHANIQDVFNEYGVQIMSPHYESDPASRKVVPKAEWFAAPAGADAVSSRRTDAAGLPESASAAGPIEAAREPSAG
jgi:small-conductance mechanosensitive channel